MWKNQSTIIQDPILRVAVYEKQKIIKNKSKVKLLLTKKNTKTLTHAHKIVESSQHIKFVFAGVNDNLKLRLNEPLEHNKYVNSTEDLKDIFDKLGWDVPQLNNEEWVSLLLYVLMSLMQLYLYII